MSADRCTCGCAGDDDFIIFEDELPTDQRLDEGKAIGTAPRHHLKLQRDRRIQKDYHTSLYTKRRKAGHATGRKVLEATQARASKNLKASLRKFKAGSVGADQFRSDVVWEMRRSWTEAFEAGVRASGTLPGAHGLVDLHPKDGRWIRSAMQHEMRFLNGFLHDVVEDECKMDPRQRAEMYVDTLRSMYEAGRVIGLPDNVLIYWVDNHDRNECPGCRLLAEHSPYTKYGLPTTPAAGSCRCLSNCRCRLYVKRVSEAAVKRAAGSAEHSRAVLVDKLRALKSGYVL